MYFIKASVTHTVEETVEEQVVETAVTETFSAFFGSAAIKLALDEFDSAVKSKFGDEAEYVVEDIKQIF